MTPSSCVHKPGWLAAALLLAAAAAWAQAPGGINRNPAYRESLPPEMPQAPDPRDSSTRPVQPPAQLPADGRSVVAEPAQAPASAPATSAPALPLR